MPRKAEKNHFIAEIRKITGINQFQFAELLGVSHSTIRSIETCRLNLSWELAATISEATGCGGWRFNDSLEMFKFPEHLRKFEGIEIRKKNGFGIYLCLSEKDSSKRPFTKDYFDKYRKIQDEVNERSVEIDRICNVLRQLLVGAIRQNVYEAVKKEVIEKLPEIDLGYSVQKIKTEDPLVFSNTFAKLVDDNCKTEDDVSDFFRTGKLKDLTTWIKVN